ncbi:MAG TPA: hypothetical protein VL287_01910 [Gemmatimonadales bacterium]|nr:hypothetical protein [Gemmatimonadales bacterium]
MAPERGGDLAINPCRPRRSHLELPPPGPVWLLRLRHFGSYPLIEDNSVRAVPTTLVNGELGYRLASGIELQLSVLNILNPRDNDIQYFYASRLPTEPASGIGDVHFHPVEPRQLRVSLGWGL